MFGHCDAQKLKTVRDRQLVAPYQNDFVENDLAVLCHELIETLYEVTPEEAHVQQLMEVRYQSFVDVVAVESRVLELLERLRTRYRVALLSNYPCGRAIRDSLERTGLAPQFEAVVVSGDVGYVKPHPTPFEALLQALKLPAADCVYVGDNWLADIQGAKRLGMQAVHTTEYQPYERFNPEPGDHEPDARIGHLDELEALLS